MPGWHEATRQARADGKLVLLGVVQEQHADRCRLFAQWQQFEWPILHDPLNKLGLRAVPVPVAIDQHGVVRETRMSIAKLAQFLETDYPPPADPPARLDAAVPDLKRLADEATRGGADSQMHYGDALLLWSDGRKINETVAVYERALESAPGRGDLHFRLGVALRMRSESEQRQATDFRRAVGSWDRALERDPNHYIYRRRIQQYGPRLQLPYPFYDWIPAAQQAIRKRGRTPVELRVPPSGAEFAVPLRRFATDATRKSPDPDGRIDRDRAVLIGWEAVTVPSTIRSGGSGRVHLRFAPSAGAYWNNEAEPLGVWLDPPAGWKVDRQWLTAARGKQAESREPRTVEFELQAPQDSREATIRGYALYYVCEQEGGTCLYLRQDIKIPIPRK